MRHIFNLIVGLIVLLTLSCRKAPKKEAKTKADTLQFQFLQINDVYEIAGVQNGKYGNLARVYYVFDSLKKENPNTYVILAGDFLSPSLYNRTPINGKQMIDVLNRFDNLIATFGNHEFDLKEKDLLQRIQEAKFTWISSNVLHKKGTQLTTFVPQTYIITKNNFKLGFIALTLPYNKKDYIHYVSYDSAITSLKKMYNDVNLWLAITHVNLSEDSVLATKNPDIPVFFGGHEHYQIIKELKNNIITKAAPNARTVIIHKIKITPQGVERSYEVMEINDKIPQNPELEKVINKWQDSLQTLYSRFGFDFNKVIVEIDSVWEAREQIIRSKQTNFGKIIARACHLAYPSSAGAFVNSGSIRVDDVLTGKITVYDILRTLPFGGGLVMISMKGSLLKKVFEASLKNRNSGGYLQYYFPEWEGLSEKEIIPKIKDNKIYPVVFTEYVASGREKNLGFLKDSPEIIKRTKPSNSIQADIRKALIEFLLQTQHPVEKP